MAFLRATKGLEPGRLCELEPGAIILGRNPNRCDVVLEHFAVSREHARIETLGDETFIEDLGSRNGVWINGSRIPPGPEGRTRLQPFDKITIAAFEFLYESETPDGGFCVMADETQKPDIYSTVDVSRDSSREYAEGSDDDSRAAKLHTVLSIIDELANALRVEEVMPRVIDSLFRSFPHAQNGFVLLRDSRTGTFQPAASRHLDSDAKAIRISRTIVDYLVNSKKAVLSGDAASDQRFERSASVQALKLRSMISAPFLDSQGEVGGLIQLEVVDGQQQFSEADLEVLAGVARHIGTVIENSQLHDAALRAQRVEFEQRFRKLIESSAQGILIHRDFEPLFANDAWAALHGYRLEEVMRLESVLPLVAQEDRQQAIDFGAARLRGESAPQRYESRAVRKDGSQIWLEMFSTVVDWDGQPAIQTTAIDLTERKRAEEVLKRSHDDLERLVQERSAELAESESLYRSLVDHLPLCVARKSLDGRFTFVNRALCELFEKDETQILGKTDADLFSRSLADKYRGDDQRVIESGQLCELFETIETSRGQQRHLHTIKTPIYDAEQNVGGTQLLFWDITSLKQAEEQRNRYAQELERSNRDLEQFAYSVSHDLQSPLRTVTNYCDLLQQRYRGQMGDDADEFLQGAIDGSRRMKRLLDDLLNYSRVSTEAQQLQATDSANVLDEATHNLSAAIREAQAVVTHDRLPTVVCDATQLMQVFQNLVGNAIRYRADRPPQIHVEASELPDAWRFAVRDNGVGIDARHFERIFSIFQRLYAEHEVSGSGVGLAICKRIVERHGGDIWLESNLGEGSTFFFTIAKAIPEDATDVAV